MCIDSVTEIVHVEDLKICIHGTLKFFSMWPNPGCSRMEVQENGQLLVMHEKYHMYEEN